ncbi:MAG TPA: ABC transporter ATP-binding protein [Mycobacteriales bacterium]|nr:ABC transporter ATP-binding protein [Mycobacteriales bacterium]
MREAGTGRPSHTLVEIRDLCVDYRTGKHSTVSVVKDINLDLQLGESLALVGESGCGKTTLALAMLRLLPKLGVVSKGSVKFRTRDERTIDLLQLGKEELRKFRWTESAVVYQGAMNSLNPLMRVRSQFAETFRAHRKDASAAQIEARSAELLELVRLEPERVLPAYPHELSGGMRQRVLIALGLLLEPQLVVLDEPTTALDILTQRSVVEVLRELQNRLNFTMVFVTHDLALAAELADRVATMYGGRIVELCDVDDTFYNPRHPYTIGLIKAVPPVSGDATLVASVSGTPPAFGELPSGCAFHPRCPYAQDRCQAEEPPLDPIGPGHSAACFYADEMSLQREEVPADV